MPREPTRCRSLVVSCGTSAVPNQPARRSVRPSLLAAASYLPAALQGLANAELRNSILGGQAGWQYLTPTGLLNGTSFEFGLGASGLGGTFGGLANASYGIIGPGSNIAHVPLSNQLPLVMSTSSSPSEAVFVISGFTLDVSHISDVTFAFGSAGTNNLVKVPEPSSVALAAFGFAGMMAWGWRRRKRVRIDRQSLGRRPTPLHRSSCVPRNTSCSALCPAS